MSKRNLLVLSEMELSYLEWGNPEQPALLLLHGLNDQAVVWSSLAEQLASHYHIVAPDLRGHGESSKPDENHYSFPEVVGDLDALWEHLGWQKAHILGHSWGAKIITYWAQQQPQRFHSLILVDPFIVRKLPHWLRITFPILYRTLSTLKGMGPFASYQQAEQQARSLAKYQPWNELQQKVFQINIEQKSDGSWGSKFTIAARNGIFKEVMAVNALNRSLTIPTLLILPEKGLNRTQWQLQPFYQYLSNLEVTSIAGNHWAFLANPEPFNQTVAAFLKKVELTH